MSIIGKIKILRKKNNKSNYIKNIKKKYLKQIH